MVSINQVEGAINHFIEAGVNSKALDASIRAKQWRKAIGILETMDKSEKNRGYYLEIANHFRSSSDLENAEKYFIEAGKPQEAVDMYVKESKWEKAYNLAVTYMPKENVNNWYKSLARDLEEKGN
jgi:intraflagellar transport protein 172